jgi:hypothetical protein
MTSTSSPRAQRLSGEIIDSFFTTETQSSQRITNQSLGRWDDGLSNTCSLGYKCVESKRNEGRNLTKRKTR